MKILLVHQNFPGQFAHLAPALAARGHDVLALTDEANRRPSPVRSVRYRTPEKAGLQGHVGQFQADMLQRGLVAARGARVLRDRDGYAPDVILGHPGWGETLFLREIWPDARLLVYAELMYRTRGQDIGFDPELTRDPEAARISTVARSGHLALSMMQADAAIAPTEYQRSSFPPEMRGKITVIHDGVATDRLAPDPDARLALPGGRVLRAGDEVLTYVSRSLEPYRGFHVFMRALPEVLAARPGAQVVVIGAEGVSYGSRPRQGESWKQVMLDELGDRLPRDRVHFLGRVPPATYRRALKVGRVHCYLTYPFVLSWSMVEAMAAGAYLVASDTEPVREFVTDGVDGRLVGFFDRPALVSALVRGLAGDPEAARLRQAARARIAGAYDLDRHTLPRQIAWLESHAPQAL